VCLRCESHSGRADLILALLGQLIVRSPIATLRMRTRWPTAMGGCAHSGTADLILALLERVIVRSLISF